MFTYIDLLLNVLWATSARGRVDHKVTLKVVI